MKPSKQNTKSDTKEGEKETSALNILDQHTKESVSSKNLLFKPDPIKKKRGRL